MELTADHGYVFLTIVGNWLVLFWMQMKVVSARKTCHVEVNYIASNFLNFQIYRLIMSDIIFFHCAVLALLVFKYEIIIYLCKCQAVARFYITGT